MRYLALQTQRNLNDNGIAIILHILDLRAELYSLLFPNARRHLIYWGSATIPAGGAI